MDDLIRYRLISAKEKLTSAKLLLDAGLYKDSVGRSYYSIFSSMRAILAIRQVDFSKHAGVISYFQKEYIKRTFLIRNIQSIFNKHFRLEMAVTMMIFLLYPDRMQRNNINGRKRY